MTDANVALETYAELLQRKNQDGVISNSMDLQLLQQLAGRVTRGSTEADFLYLQKNREAKKFAWVMGDDGLALFLTQSNLQALRSIGFDDQWIRRRLETGERFRLGVFPRSTQCVLATWDGVVSLIDQHYSGEISQKVRRHVETLREMIYDEIEARARLSYLNGASYFDVDELASNGHSTDPRFMSEERFAQCEGTLEEARGFLYNRLGLSRLYDGSGFTKDFTGRLIVREYLQPNVPVQEIPGFRYLDLPIDDAELMSTAY